MNLLHGDAFDVVVNSISFKTLWGADPEVCIEGTLISPKSKTPTIDITKVIFNNPATIVYWKDGTRTVVKCQPGDEFNHTTGFLMCLMKKMYGNTGRYNEVLKKYVYGADLTPDEMRNKLQVFCDNRTCEGCYLNKPGFVCGRGKWFFTDKSEAGYMSDDEIRAHYEAMKGANR